MILALDVGNSQIYAGLCDGEKILVNFRKNSKTGYSSDEIGIFLRGVIRENGYDPTSIRQIVMCSVVPDLVHSLRSACRKYFGMYPFILQAGVKTGLKIKYKNPLEVGADRIANAIGATALFPDQNIIIVDMGTATTFCAVRDNKEYLGGTIVAGLRLCMEALESKTAKLPAVEIVKTEFALGKNTVESIQSGLYFSHVGIVKEICQRLTDECFGGKRPVVVGTGGFSSLFEKEKLFNHIIPDLVITGLLTAHKMNL